MPIDLIFPLSGQSSRAPRCFQSAGNPFHRREDLVPVLGALGLDKVRRAATALQRLAPGAMPSRVVQCAMIEIDEEGAEAAAATAVMSSRRLGVDDGIHMVVDKPFIYALRDRATGLILSRAT